LTRRFEGVHVDRELEIRLETTSQSAVKSPVLCGFHAAGE
jgi:hypothetical protein